jgi:hypothetical protein
MRAAVLVTVAALGITLVGCSGKSPSPKVASLGTVTTTAAPASGGAKPGASDLAKMESYASCMRSHGIPDFPDPVAGSNGGGGFQIKSGPGGDLDPNSTKFVAADTACKPLLPNGGVAPPMSAAQQAAFLAWAACIRTHGVPSFPDPVFKNGGVEIRMAAPAGTGGGGPSGPPPQLVAAQAACKSKLPGGGPGLLGG